MTIYKAEKKYILDNSLFLIFPLLFTISTLLEGTMIKMNEWIGLLGFWTIGLFLILVPLRSKLEITEDYVLSYMFGFPLLRINKKDIQSIEYANLFRGGLGYGKGLNIRFLKNGKSKTTSIGEKFWGKDAIEHAKRVLENK